MKKQVLTLMICAISLAGFSQDRYFARTYTSNVLPKGAIDLEFWHTSRFGHEGQFFHAQDQRMELEFGLGKKLQTAFYFNRFQKRFSESANETVVSNEVGFSNEWKYQLSSPSKKKIGAALYGEWSIKGGDELELETKLILDKEFGKSLLAFNGIVEFEKEFEWVDGKLKSDNYKSPIEFDLAYLYNVGPSVGLGFELVNHNDIAKGKGWQNSIIYGGPTFNYRSDGWFVIANYLPQWSNIHKTSHSPSYKVLDEHERTEARIIIGISLK